MHATDDHRQACISCSTTRNLLCGRYIGGVNPLPHLCLSYTEVANPGPTRQQSSASAKPHNQSVSGFRGGLARGKTDGQELPQLYRTCNLSLKLIQGCLRRLFPHGSPASWPCVGGGAGAEAQLAPPASSAPAPATGDAPSLLGPPAAGPPVSSSRTPSPLASAAHRAFSAIASAALPFRT